MIKFGQIFDLILLGFIKLGCFWDNYDKDAKVVT